MHTSSIYAGILHSAHETPEKLAVILDDEAKTYAELLNEIDRLSNHLRALGIKNGDHIGVILPNCIEFVCLLFAAARIGAVLVPQSPSGTRDQVRRTFMAASVEHLVCWHGVVKTFFPEDDPQHPSGARVLVGGTHPNWSNFDSLPTDVQEDTPSVAPSSPFLILLTSGSTGAPKPILLTQATKLARAQSAIRLYHITRNDVVLAATPMYHSLAQRLVLVPLISGGTSIIMEHFTPSAWLDIAERHGVTFTIAVSSQLKQIIPLLDTRPPPSRLRCLVSSSAALDPASKTALLERTDFDFHEIYGASEIASATDLSARNHTARIDTVGLPIDDVEILILGRDGTPQPTGERGEIICRTPLAFSGYYNAPEATDRAMWNGFFRTGDEGMIDVDGFLHFHGRIKDIIIVGGINVYPKDIEEVVESCPDVHECAAIAVEDPRLGEVVGLVVAPPPGSPPVDLRTLRKLCANNLSDAQQPHHYFQVDYLPRNPMGKIDKPALRTRFSSPKGKST